MSNEGVWIKLKVPVALHGELRTRAFHVGEKLGKYVEGILDSYCAIAKVGGVGPKIEQKQAKVKPESSGANNVSSPLEKPATAKPIASTTYSGNCSKCGAKEVKTTINNQMKEICYLCAGVKP